MTDTRELVDELRLIGCHANGDARCTCGIGQDAADTITALSERCSALEEALGVYIVLYGDLDGNSGGKLTGLWGEIDRAALTSGGRG